MKSDYFLIKRGGGGKSLTKFPFTLFTSYPYQSKVPYISIQHKYCIKVKRGTVNG